MRVLVTGGLGFIGSHTVVALLENGYDVTVIDNLYNSKLVVKDRIKEITNKDFKTVIADVQDEKALDEIFKDKIDAVINFAGYKAVGESVKKPLEYYDNNLTLTFVLLKKMREYGCHNFVFSSSATVYGNPERVPMYETDPVTDATSPYGETKVMIERILKDIAAVTPDFNCALLRYFNPIGAHKSGLLGEDPNGIPNNLLPYIAKVATGELKEVNVFGNDYDTPDGTGVRDYIHVVDLAKGHVLALKKLEQNPGLVIYNLGTGKGTSVLEMIHDYEEATGVKIPYVIKPRRAGDIATSYANCDKAAKELGFHCDYTVLDACRDGYHFQVEEAKRKKEGK